MYLTNYINEHHRLILLVLSVLIDMYFAIAVMSEFNLFSLIAGLIPAVIIAGIILGLMMLAVGIVEAALEGFKR